jgi:hypothetical protein
MMQLHGTNDWRERMQAEIASLRTLRDELRVRVHLGAKDARDRFQDAERAWHKLEGRLEELGRATAESADEVGAAVRLLASTVRDAYGHIKEAL